MEGLGSTRTISAVKGTSANGGTTDFIDVPDFLSRHKYLETALKLKKRLSDKLADVELGAIEIRIVSEKIIPDDRPSDKELPEATSHI